MLLDRAHLAGNAVWILLELVAVVAMVAVVVLTSGERAAWLGEDDAAESSPGVA